MKINQFLLLIIIIFGAVLRLYNLSSNPPSLYWDEASLGYNAFSILKYGVDEHGESYPLSRFIAFGDFKPPGYIYATVPSILIFGVNEFAIRFPSAISGILLIVVTYLLANEIFNNKKVALLGALFIAISPWSLQLSRGAFEANVATLLNAFAIYFFLKVEKNRGIYLPLSFILFILSFYTFNANRVIAPLLLITLFILKFKNLLSIKKWVFTSLILGFILIIPSFSYLQSRESKVRFQEVSIFNNLEILKRSNQRIETHSNSFLTRIIHNRRIDYTREFFNHFFDHFKTDFLFISGDKNPRLSAQTVGLLYVYSLPFLIVGAFLALRNFKKSTLFLFTWLIISMIPSAVSKETPHALRTASILPIYDLLIGYGIWSFYRFINNMLLKRIIVSLGAILLIFNLYYYLHNYYVHYPRDWSGEWQYGYKQAVMLTKQLEDKYDYIVVTNALERPYIYFLLYEQVDPNYYLTTRIASRDWFGVWEIGGFGKYRFGMDKIKDLQGNILIVGTPQETKDLSNKIETINSPKGDPILVVGSL